MQLETAQKKQVFHFEWIMDSKKFKKQNKNWSANVMLHSIFSFLLHQEIFTNLFHAVT